MNRIIKLSGMDGSPTIINRAAVDAVKAINNHCTTVYLKGGVELQVQESVDYVCNWVWLEDAHPMNEADAPAYQDWGTWNKTIPVEVRKKDLAMEILATLEGFAK
jgi:uncharacterized protein YlzI (FlbEa/FlbD family)